MTHFTFEKNEDGTVKKAVWSFDNNARYYYATDNCGEGIFMYDRSAGNSKQLTGTCQFSVYKMKPNSARAKINKWFKQRY